MNNYTLFSYSTPFSNGNTTDTNTPVSTTTTTTKRKLEEDMDDYTLMSHKRLYKLNTLPSSQEQQQQQQQQQYKENDILPFPIMAQSIYSNGLQGEDTLKDSNNSTLWMIQGKKQVDMMDYDLTDEDESSQTPGSNNNDFLEEDEDDDGGYIGDLERGWSEMFNQNMYYDCY